MFQSRPTILLASLNQRGHQTISATEESFVVPFHRHRELFVAVITATIFDQLGYFLVPSDKSSHGVGRSCITGGPFLALFV